MKQDDFKRLLDESLKPIKEDLSGVKEDLSGIKETLENHTGALVRIESVLEGYADAYKVNKGNIERLDKRLIKVEDHLEIHPSDQLAIQR